MGNLTSCTTSSTLSVYEPSVDNPWNVEKVNHVFRRLCFGASKMEIENALLKTPSQFIDDLVDQAINTTVTSAPLWANLTFQDYIDIGLNASVQMEKNHGEWRIMAFDQFLTHGLRGRLNFFWSNHFVAQLKVYYCSNFLFEYNKLIETHSLGNFKDFVEAIGKSNAMLIYLNGVENTANKPNENYARELYELFTLGLNNGYNQLDIVETAKALTGFNDWEGSCKPVNFNPLKFNNTNKTIFGRTGNWGYEDVINILFEEKGTLIANYICEKLYKYFVSSDLNENIINEMAAMFILDFNIANVLRKLFKSEHFFDSKNLGSLIKSPYDHTHCFIKTTGFNYNLDFKTHIIWSNDNIGQVLFNPVDVAGWPGDRDWINSSTFVGRWRLIQHMISVSWNNDPEMFRNFAILSSDGSTDPSVITRAIIHRFVPKELQTTLDYDIATNIFKYDIPENYYTNGTWSLYFSEAPYQVLLLLIHIFKMPEFQLK